MDMLQKLTGPELSLSCEYFPPRNPSGWSALYATLATAHETGLDFVSVTYGAGGSTRQKTISLVERIQNELNIDTIAHLSCAGHSRAHWAKSHRRAGHVGRNADGQDLGKLE